MIITVYIRVPEYATEPGDCFVHDAPWRHPKNDGDRDFVVDVKIPYKEERLPTIEVQEEEAQT